MKCCLYHIIFLELFQKSFLTSHYFWQGYMKNKSDKICFSFYCLSFVSYIMTNLFLMSIYTLANIIRKKKKLLKDYIWVAKLQKSLRSNSSSQAQKQKVSKIGNNKDKLSRDYVFTIHWMFSLGIHKCHVIGSE